MSQALTNYTGRDFSAEFERLIALLKSECPEYTDWNHADIGIVILRLLARETDQINFYVDQVFREGFLRTARFRQSLIELGTLVDYLPTLASPASTLLRLTRVDGVTGAISIPKHTPFERADGLAYLTTEAVEIADGADSVDVYAIQGVEATVELSAAAFSIQDWSKRPKHNLGVGVVSGHCELTHGDPALSWTEVDSFFRSFADDRHFRLELNGDTDEVWLTLGDGVQGQGPPDETLTVKLVRTAGAAGNCGHSTIYLTPDGLDGQITCINLEPATGGAASESADSLRRSIPRVTQAQRRAVTTPDYEALVEHLAGVLHCSACDRNDSPAWPHMHVVLFVVPDGGGLMSSYLKEQIWALCGAKGALQVWRNRYILKDAILVPTNVSMRVGVLSGYQSSAVTSAVQTAVQALFDPENLSIGGGLDFDVLHRTASAVAGVSWVDFDAPTGDVTAGQGEILTAGVITATAA